MSSKTLIFVPTYNEKDNAPRMCEALFALGLDADVLFTDDNSPDGTGQLLDALKARFPRLIVRHRPSKLGIGSAHAEGIQWAYDQGYARLVTLDCDFTHSPTDVPALLQATDNKDIAIGSRWVTRNSLPGWNIFRLCMTRLGHLLTTNVLGVTQDASGAFRVYRLDKIPRQLFSLVQSRGYSFFFESLFIFNRNGLTIQEIPIVLPARTYGSSKMTASAAGHSATYIFKLALAHLRRPEQFLIEREGTKIDPSLVDPQNWNSYWQQQTDGGAVYEVVAGVYRRAVIKKNLAQVIFNEFASNSKLLHTGCGSGQVDVDLQYSMQLTALDISPEALRRYGRNNPRAAQIKHGSVFDLHFADQSFDGVYNLGLVEHFTEDEIVRMALEFHRVLRPDGKLVLFWPHARASSVQVLKCVHFLLNRVARRATQLHPPEITHCRGAGHARDVLAKAGFKLQSYEFGSRDFFVQSVVVATKAS